MIFILGGSGYIGRHLYRHLEDRGYPVKGSCCTSPKAGLIPFDLETDRFPPAGLTLSGMSHVILAAASTTKIDEAGRHYARHFAVDAVNTGRLLETVKAAGIIPVFISTDFVFNGKKGHYSETDPVDPVNGYGRIKAATEKQIQENFRQYLIIRVGKVFGLTPGDGTLVTALVEGLRRGQAQNCALDQQFTPVLISDLTAFIEQAIRTSLSGTYHLASIRPTNRHRIALAAAEVFGFDRRLIKACRINELGLPEKRPLKIDLDVSRALALTGKSLSGIQSILTELKTGTRHGTPQPD